MSPGTRRWSSSRRLFVVNAYSMGAWATGTNTGIAMARIATVKNTGPDLEKIVDTLRHFGPRYDYLVTAYPPFLKHLRDRLVHEPWFRGYRMAAMVGGEGMTEALRDYVGDVFSKVRSGYGASDLTIGMGGETTFTVWLRRLMRADPEVRAVFLGRASSGCRWSSSSTRWRRTWRRCRTPGSCSAPSTRPLCSLPSCATTSGTRPR
ncbi:hypothetical protein ACFQZC_11475 [Streptacidiphilus monticola]